VRVTSDAPDEARPQHLPLIDKVCISSYYVNG
jgi:hypothetical protein